MKSIYTCAQWKADIETVMPVVPELDSMAGKTILITGATGMICSAVADLLISYNECSMKPIHIIAAGRSAQKVSDRFAQYSQREYFSFIPYDATAPRIVPELHADYIIHGASNSSPDMIVKEPVETMASNFDGMKNWLEYAREHRTAKILYISSSEVYGKKDKPEPFREEEYGYIDLLAPRNAYSVAKRAAETLCAAYADEYGVDAVIIRPGHIYGPTATPTDSHVSSAWAYAAAQGKEIVMKSAGNQIRSYCYCLDAATAILKVLLRGENVHAYNISNPESVISVKEMAEILAKAGGVELRRELPSNEEKRGFNPMNNSALDGSSLISLGWKGCFDAGTGFSHTVQIIKERTA